MSTRDNIDWVFPNLRKRGAGTGGDLTQFTMSGELETFVREVLQNSNDASYAESDEPVEVGFKIREIEGETFEDFQEAFSWDKWKSQVDAAAGDDNDIARRIKQYADQVEERESIRIVVIEDRYTEGLTGPDEDEPQRSSTNFSALVRDSLESNKSESAAGGKFGLGKAVLRIFSGTSTVLFNSILSEPDPRPDSPRLVGRTRLPQHWRDGTRHNGQGFFGDTTVCENEHDPPTSLWGDDAQELAEKLRINREDSDVPGTSIVIVGFRDPTREEPREVDELAREIRDEAVKWFWPAIWRDDLRVKVGTESTTYDADITQSEEIQDFVDCLEEDTERVEEREVNEIKLEEDERIARVNVPIDIPNKDDRSEDEEMPSDGKVSLSLKLVDEEESQFTNSVAMIRGAGMVVRYWDRSKLVHGNRNFKAVLLGGEARAWTEPDEPSETEKKVETFLQDAEPPAHDNWEQTDATRDDYLQGTKAALNRMFGDAEDVIGSLVSPNFDRGAMGPQLLANRFPVTNQGTSDEPTGDANVEGRVDISRDGSSDRWEFSGKVEPTNDAYEISEVHITLPRMGEERQIQNDYVRVDRFTEFPDSCSQQVSTEDEGRTIVVKDGSKSEIEFSGVSSPDSIGSKTRINVDATLSPVEEDET